MCHPRRLFSGSPRNLCKSPASYSGHACTARDRLIGARFLFGEMSLFAKSVRVGGGRLPHRATGLHLHFSLLQVGSFDRGIPFSTSDPCPFGSFKSTFCNNSDGQMLVFSASSKVMVQLSAERKGERKFRSWFLCKDKSPPRGTDEFSWVIRSCIFIPGTSASADFLLRDETSRLPVCEYVNAEIKVGEYVNPEIRRGRDPSV